MWDTSTATLSLATDNALKTRKQVLLDHLLEKTMGVPSRYPQHRGPGPNAGPSQAPLADQGVTSDASDVGCDQGHQAYRGWEDGMRESHINLRELWVAKEWLLRHPHIRNTAIRFDMNNTATVPCIARQGTARSSALLKLTEEIFALASERNIHLAWCPNPLLLGSACLVDNDTSPFQSSLKLHAWSFLSYTPGVS
ncbi:hypothetical protein O3P69_009130 [Scylla paramamosain]|uniref:Uncharacterized protein n=1 Tax=Scylla paramamosain TaxID=85552 RepID=A0AAW0T9K3_SCYPA